MSASGHPRGNFESADADGPGDRKRGTRITYRVTLELTVGTDVEETAGRVIRTSTESIAVGEELDGVDIGIVGRKGLDTFLLTDIPELGEGIARTRDELVVVERVDAQAHHVTQVVGELVDLGTGFQIPQDTGHVTRRGEDASVADETAAAEVSRVARQFPGDTGRAIARRQVVDGADVIQTTAGDVVPAGRVGAGHDPRGSKGDGVDLVRRVRIPDDELAILRRRDEMAAVGRPVHGIDLRQVALEGALGLHGQPRQLFDAVARDIANCKQKKSG
jgi:hypothetical protein